VEVGILVQLSSGVTRRLGPAGSRWWQLASHWAAYVRYLEALERDLDHVRVPGIGDASLSDAFVPLRLRAWDDSRNGFHEPAATGPLVTLAEALAKEARVLAVGPAGTGKTALLRSHAMEVARQARQAGRFGLLAEGGPAPLPVYIALAAAPEAVPLEQVMLAEMQRAGFEAAEEFLAAHLETGNAVVLVDDLDTVRPAARRSAAQRVLDLAARYPETKMVVVTRDVSDREWLPGFRVLDVVGIDPGQVETLTRKWGYEQLANTSGFLQVVERSPLVRSLVARPGWLAAGLAGVSTSDEPCRAFDIVDSFVRHLDPATDAEWGATALRLQEGQTTVGAASELPPDRRSSGLLQWLSAEEFRFVHTAVQAYFAASALAKDPQRLLEHAGEAWWEPVTVLAVGFLDDPRQLIEGLLAGGHTTLAGLALAEARMPAPVLVEQVQVALLEALGNRGTASDRAAAIALAGLVTVESVRRTGIIAPVLDALASGTAPVRRAAAAALGRLEDPSAIPALLNAFGDDDEHVRRSASEALATFGERTVQPLVRQLSLPNETVRAAAIDALAVQGERAVSALIPLLEGSSATGRLEAAETLAKIGSGAVPALIDVLRGAPPEGMRSESSVEGAADALTRIGRPAAEALVPMYAEASPATRRRIVDILRAMGGKAVEALSDIIVDEHHPNSGTAAGLVGDLPTAGPSAASCLIAGLSDPRFEVRWEARRSLRRLGTSVLSQLVDTLDSGDPDVRWAAAQILMALPEPPLEHLLPVLTTMLDAPDVAVRRRAVRALGALSGPSVRQALEHAARDSDPVVRRSAISLIGASGDRDALPVLVGLWSEEHDEDARLSLLHSLVSLDEEQAIPTLIDGLAADTPEVRREASELLAEIGEPAVIPLVEARCTSSSEPAPAPGPAATPRPTWRAPTTACSWSRWRWTSWSTSPQRWSGGRRPTSCIGPSSPPARHCSSPRWAASAERRPTSSGSTTWAPGCGPLPSAPCASCA
jgi:HEAT repeat protein